MKFYDTSLKYMDAINAIGGTIVAVLTAVGWFTLASLIINELRSILENFVEAGDNVPSVLTKGLEVAENAINKGE